MFEVDTRRICRASIYHPLAKRRDWQRWIKSCSLL